MIRLPLVEGTTDLFPISACSSIKWGKGLVRLERSRSLTNGGAVDAQMTNVWWEILIEMGDDLLMIGLEQNSAES